MSRLGCHRPGYRPKIPRCSERGNQSRCSHIRRTRNTTRRRRDERNFARRARLQRYVNPSPQYISSYLTPRIQINQYTMSMRTVRTKQVTTVPVRKFSNYTNHNTHGSSSREQQLKLSRHDRQRRRSFHHARRCRLRVTRRFIRQRKRIQARSPRSHAGNTFLVAEEDL